MLDCCPSTGGMQTEPAGSVQGHKQVLEMAIRFCCWTSHCQALLIAWAEQAEHM